ncbi:hypothetical protein ACOMHN_019795 [Nucella lapillus]
MKQKCGSSSSGCPNAALRSGYLSKVHNGRCYLFVDRERYWGDARDSCSKMGGHLLTIEDYGTMVFIRSVLNSRELGWDKRGVWLGAKYTGGRWKWITGKQMGYANWASGQPSKMFGLISFEDCGLMRRQDNWRWHDSMCGRMKFHFNYICQFPVEDYTTTTSTTTTTTTTTSTTTTNVAPAFKPGQHISKKGRHFLDQENGRLNNHRGRRPEKNHDEMGEGEDSGVDHMQNGFVSNPPYNVHNRVPGHPYDRRPAYTDRGYNEVHSTSHFPDNGKMTILTIILVTGGIVLLILLMIFLIIRKRYNYKKAIAQPTVHFENRNYNHAHSGSGSGSGSASISRHASTPLPLPPPPAPHTFHRTAVPPVPPRPLPTQLPHLQASAAARTPTAPYVPHSRPVSDLYLTPVEIGGGGGGYGVGGIYEEVQLPRSSVASRAHTSNLTHTPARSVDALGATGGMEHEDSATVPLISASGALWGQSEESLHSMSGSLTMKTSSIHNDYVDMNGALVLPTRTPANNTHAGTSSKMNEGLDLEPQSEESDPKDEISRKDVGSDGTALEGGEGKQTYNPYSNLLMTASQERGENLYAQLIH